MSPSGCPRRTSAFGFQTGRGGRKMAFSLASILGGGVLDGVGNVVEKVAGVFGTNKEADARRQFELADMDTRALISAQSQFAREFHAPRNWFDSIINGLNRLPRPFMAFGAIALLIGPFIDPIEYSASIAALGLIPEYLWGIIGGVFAFYFGARHWENKRRTQVTLDHAKGVMDHMQKIRELKPRKAAVTESGETIPTVLENEDELEDQEHQDWNAPADRLARAGG